MHFEILCLDNAEAVKSRSVRTLLYALMANDSLFGDVGANGQKGGIKEKKRPLLLRVNQFPTDKMLTGARYSVAFTISVESDELATLDREQNISLRGIYFCKDKKCLEKAKELLRKDKLVLKKHFNKESLIKIIDNIENELGE